jgi:hypothetical protein
VALFAFCEIVEPVTFIQELWGLVHLAPLQELLMEVEKKRIAGVI